MAARRAQICGGVPHTNIASLPRQLSSVWVACHYEKKLAKKQVVDADIPDTVGRIVEFISCPHASLRITGGLLVGVTRLYGKKIEYFQLDCSDVLRRMQTALPSDALGELENHEGASSSLMNRHRNGNGRQRFLLPNGDAAVEVGPRGSKRNRLGVDGHPSASNSKSDRAVRSLMEDIRSTFGLDLDILDEYREHDDDEATLDEVAAQYASRSSKDDIFSRMLMSSPSVDLEGRCLVPDSRESAWTRNTSEGQTALALLNEDDEFSDSTSSSPSRCRIDPSPLTSSTSAQHISSDFNMSSSWTDAAPRTGGVANSSSKVMEPLLKNIDETWDKTRKLKHQRNGGPEPLYNEMSLSCPFGADVPSFFDLNEDELLAGLEMECDGVVVVDGDGDGIPEKEGSSKLSTRVPTASVSAPSAGKISGVAGISTAPPPPSASVETEDPSTEAPMQSSVDPENVEMQVSADAGGRCVVDEELSIGQTQGVVEQSLHAESSAYSASVVASMLDTNSGSPAPDIERLRGDPAGCLNDDYGIANLEGAGVNRDDALMRLEEDLDMRLRKRSSIDDEGEVAESSVGRGTASSTSMSARSAFSYTGVGDGDLYERLMEAAGGDTKEENSNAGEMLRERRGLLGDEHFSSGFRGSICSDVVPSMSGATAAETPTRESIDGLLLEGDLNHNEQPRGELQENGVPTSAGTYQSESSNEGIALILDSAEVEADAAGSKDGVMVDGEVRRRSWAEDVEARWTSAEISVERGDERIGEPPLLREAAGSSMSIGCQSNSNDFKCNESEAVRQQRSRRALKRPVKQRHVSALDPRGARCCIDTRTTLTDSTLQNWQGNRGELLRQPPPYVAQLRGESDAIVAEADLDEEGPVFSVPTTQWPFDNSTVAAGHQRWSHRNGSSSALMSGHHEKDVQRGSLRSHRQFMNSYVLAAAAAASLPNSGCLRPRLSSVSEMAGLLVSPEDRGRTSDSAAVLRTLSLVGYPDGLQVGRVQNIRSNRHARRLIHLRFREQFGPSAPAQTSDTASGEERSGEEANQRSTEELEAVGPAVASLPSERGSDDAADEASKERTALRISPSSPPMTPSVETCSPAMNPTPAVTSGLPDVSATDLRDRVSTEESSQSCETSQDPAIRLEALREVTDESVDTNTSRQDESMQPSSPRIGPSARESIASSMSFNDECGLTSERSSETFMSAAPLLERQLPSSEEQPRLSSSAAIDLRAMTNSESVERSCVTEDLMSQSFGETPKRRTRPPCVAASSGAQNEELLVALYGLDGPIVGSSCESPTAFPSEASGRTPFKTPFGRRGRLSGGGSASRRSPEQNKTKRMFEGMLDESEETEFLERLEVWLNKSHCNSSRKSSDGDELALATIPEDTPSRLQQELVTPYPRSRKGASDEFFSARLFSKRSLRMLVFIQRRLETSQLLVARQTIDVMGQPSATGNVEEKKKRTSNRSNNREPLALSESQQSSVKQCAVAFAGLAAGHHRMTVSAAFFELLTLKSGNFIEIEQNSGDLLIFGNSSIAGRSRFASRC